MGEYVYFSSDSRRLAGYLPYNNKTIKNFDLCTGSGIQAILLSKTGRIITGTELNPLSANVARFNVSPNGLYAYIKIYEGNLFEPVRHEKYNLIISNPPFLPIPDTLKYPVCSNGGEDGRRMF